MLRILTLVSVCSVLAACARGAAPTDAAGAPVDAAAPRDPAASHAPIATFTRITMMRRVLDGGARTSGTEVLVVYADREVEIRDGHAAGALLAKGTAQPEPFSALESALSAAEWGSLPEERGTPVPDGALHVIEVRGRRVKRYGDPTDEPVVRKAVAGFEQIWRQLAP